MVLESLAPVIALISLGAALRRFGLAPPAFFATADRLVYFVFFPLLLFWKIGGGGPAFVGGAAYLAAAACSVLVVFLLSTLFIGLRVGPYQAGSFSQNCYRFNTYIGMAVAASALGEEGVRCFGILIGFLIPLINVLAVSVLTWFGRSRSASRRVPWMVKALATNPLIIACLAGIAYARTVGGFPAFLDDTFRLGAGPALPLALLSIGNALTFDSVRTHLPLSLAAAGFKLVVLPVVGIGFLHLFGVSGLPYRVSLLFFALPASTAIYVLSAQLNSDTELASSAIVVSTLLSAIPLTVVLSGFSG